MRLCTAEQQARRRLELVVASHKEFEPAIREGMNHGGDILVELEKKIQKKLLLEASREHERSKNPEHNRPRSADLGRTSLERVPFAVETVAGDAHRKKSSFSTAVSSRRTYQNATARSVSECTPPVKFSKKLDLVRLTTDKAPPYDTTTQSTTYPEPPQVGVAGHAHHGKGHVEVHTERKNIDEELQRRAAARCHFSAHHRDTNFVATQERVDEQRRSPARASTLSATQEARCKAMEDHKFSARRGKMVAEEKYRSTALW
jgi:hypothetical protein